MKSKLTILSKNHCALNEAGKWRYNINLEDINTHGLHIKFLKHVLIQFLKAILTPCFVSIPSKWAHQSDLRTEGEKQHFAYWDEPKEENKTNEYRVIMSNSSL